jgi:riboflavin kinase/FMN adenylyltransferase
VVHVGPRPTFRERDKSIEAHLFGRKRDLYGRELELFFIQKLRPTRRFRDSGRLARAIRQDTARAKRILS